ncbi:B12-binding domain-containing radical SAM protein [Patescibacteria group bacterium]|nr:B12-binding domain-containing radical SAM protein [Patescibacteria group bacterium]
MSTSIKAPSVKRECTHRDLKVFLIKPTVKYPLANEDCDIPLGLCSIIKFVRESMPSGIEIDLIDERLNKLNGGINNTEREIDQADVVGVSACTNEFPRALKLLKLAHTKGKVTVLGGVFPSGNPYYLMDNYPFIDYVVAGEGEIAFQKLLEVLKSNRLDQLKDIKGLFFRQEGQSVFGGKAERLVNIPRIIDLYQNGTIDTAEYFRAGREKSYRVGIVPTMATRGCPGNCKICSMAPVWQGKQLQRPIDNILEEMMFFQNIDHVLGVNFKDDELFANKEYARKLFLAIINAKKEGKLDKKFKFKCKSRIKSMNQEMLDLAAQAGAYCIQYGVETTNPSILKEMKGVTLEQVRKVLSGSMERGITINPTFIFGGLEGQTEQDLLDAGDFAASFGQYPDIKPYMTYYTPHPRDGHFSLAAGTRIRQTDLNYFNHKHLIVDSEELPADVIIAAYRRAVQITNSGAVNPLTSDNYTNIVMNNTPNPDSTVPTYSFEEPTRREQ